MGIVAANFPTTIWDGSSSSRSNTNVFETPALVIDRPPDAGDWSQIVSELIAVQTQLVNSGGAWIAITPTNSWTQKAASVVFAYKLVNKTVRVKGALNPGTTTGGTSVGTLPAAARPLFALSFALVPNAADTGEAVPTRVVVGTDGTLKVYGLTGASVSIDLGIINFQLDE